MNANCEEMSELERYLNSLDGARDISKDRDNRDNSSIVYESGYNYESKLKYALDNIKSLFCSIFYVTICGIVADTIYLTRRLAKYRIIRLETNYKCNANRDNISSGSTSFIRLCILSTICALCIFNRLKSFLMHYSIDPVQLAPECPISYYIQRIIYISSFTLIVFPLTLALVMSWSFEHTSQNLDLFHNTVAISFQLLRSSHQFTSKLSHALKPSEKLKYLDALYGKNYAAHNSRCGALNQASSCIDGGSIRMKLKESILLSHSLLNSTIYDIVRSNKLLSSVSTLNKQTTRCDLHFKESNKPSELKELKQNSKLLLEHLVPQFLLSYFILRDCQFNNESDLPSLGHSFQLLVDFVRAIACMGALCNELDSENRRLRGCIANFKLNCIDSNSIDKLSADNGSIYLNKDGGNAGSPVVDKDKDYLVDLVSIVNLQLISDVTEMKEAIGCLYHNISEVDSILRTSHIEIFHNISRIDNNNNNNSNSNSVDFNSKHSTISLDHVSKLIEVSNLLSHITSLDLSYKDCKGVRGDNNKEPVVHIDENDANQREAILSKLRARSLRCADALKLSLERCCSLNVGDSVVDLADVILNQSKYCRLIDQMGRSAMKTNDNDIIDPQELTKNGIFESTNELSEDDIKRDIRFDYTSTHGEEKDAALDTTDKKDYLTELLRDHPDIRKNIIQIYSAISNPNRQPIDNNTMRSCDVNVNKSLSRSLMMELKCKVDSLKESFEELDVSGKHEEENGLDDEKNTSEPVNVANRLLNSLNISDEVSSNREAESQAPVESTSIKDSRSHNLSDQWRHEFSSSILMMNRKANNDFIGSDSD